MIFEGLLLAGMTFASMILTFLKLPRVIQNFFLQHKLLTDVISGVIVYLVIGAISKSIVAIVGAIFTSLLVGLSLEVASNDGTIRKAINNPT